MRDRERNKQLDKKQWGKRGKETKQQTKTQTDKKERKKLTETWRLIRIEEDCRKFFLGKDVVVVKVGFLHAISDDQRDDCDLFKKKQIKYLYPELLISFDTGVKLQTNHLKRLMNV